MTVRESCGCYVSDIPWGKEPGEQGSIVYCPLHSAAPELLSQLQSQHRELEDQDTHAGWDDHKRRPCMTCRLIAQAERKLS